MSKFIKVIQILIISLMLFVSSNALTLKKIYSTNNSAYNQLSMQNDKGSAFLKCEIIKQYDKNLNLSETNTISAFPPLIMDLSAYFDKHNKTYLKIQFDYEMVHNNYTSNEELNKKNFLETIMNYHLEHRDQITYDPPINMDTWQADCIEDNSIICVKNFEKTKNTKPDELCPIKIIINKIPGIMMISDEAIWQTQIKNTNNTIKQFIDSNLILV